jgi:phosphatidylinositol alpha-1,6-mannosyltransferase
MCYLGACLRWRPALVFVDHLHLAVVPYLSRWLIGPRWVLFCHGTEFDGGISPIRRAAFCGAALRLSNSQFTAYRLKKLFPGVAIVPCELGLDESARGPAVETNLDLLPDAFGVPQGLGERVVLIVGRLSSAERYKGHDQLIAIMPALIARVPDAQLIVAGDGNDIDRLRALARRGGAGQSILFAGFVPPASRDALFGRCRLFAMPSRKEGFGLVYLEAMQFAKPCIASRIDAGSEVVVDGSTGLLVDPADQNALLQAIAGVLEDDKLARHMGQNGFERLNRHYRFVHFRQRLQQCLSQLIPEWADGSPDRPSEAELVAAIGVSRQ